MDDEEPIRSVMQRTLETAGYTVKVAASAIEAAPHFDTGARAIDVVISDWALPNIDGGAFAERIRAQGFAGSIVLMSGSDSFETSRFPGAHARLTKPFTAEQLLGAVKRSLLAQT